MNTDEMEAEIHTLRSVLATVVRGQHRARHGRARLRRRVTRGLAAVGFVAVGSLPFAAQSYDPVPTNFEAGDPISAAQMNANFDHVVAGVTDLEGRVAPIGSVMAWAGSSALAPSGWLFCDGASYSAGVYPELANVLGGSHGGDGVTDFFVPDMRGRFVRGVDGGVGRDPDALTRSEPQVGSGNTGDLVGSIQGDALGQHVHGTPVSFPFGDPANDVFGTGTAGLFDNVLTAVASANNFSTQNSQEVGAAETRGKNIYLHFIIRAE